MKCRLHYVLITYLCRSKYTPHTRTHTQLTLTQHGTHHIYAESHQMHCILCGDPAANFSSTCAVCLPHSKLFLLPSASLLSLFLSLSLPSILQLMVGSCLLSSSFLVLLFLLFSLQFDAFACLLILVYLPSICIRSTCPLPPLPSAVAPSFKDKLNQFPIDRVMRCFFCSIFPWTLPQLPA